MSHVTAHRPWEDEDILDSGRSDSERLPQAKCLLYTYLLHQHNFLETSSY
jgi:hypothetical protein